MKQDVLRLLKEHSGTFFSGEALSKHFGVSRTAVWKVIKQLKESGYPIESVNNKGYRITSSVSPYNQDELRYRLRDTMYDGNCHFFAETTSTSDEVKQISSKSDASAIVCIAELQTKGRGRLGRQWQSPSGKGIWMSILLKPNIPPELAAQLTQVAAVSVVDALKEITGHQAGIKWPNDIIMGKKKVCGILTEMSAEIGSINHVVLGIGMNVDNEVFNEELAETATSLYLETGEHQPRADIVEAILKRFELLYKEFLKTQTLSGCIDACRSYSVTLGSEITVIQPARTIHARAVALSETGELIIEHKDGERETIYYGEVSVRGINGYV